MYVEPVIGYRTWLINIGMNELRSPVMQSSSWPTDEPISAKCVEHLHESKRFDGPHESPKMGCTCGVYAWHELDDALAYNSCNAFSVVGAAIGWGKFVVSPRGFRMQYMRPLAVADHFTEDARPLGWPSVLEAVLKKYKIPILPVDLVQEYAETWGSPMGTSFTQ